jgi:tetratricopeptide (TPR) repeat protein
MYVTGKTRRPRAAGLFTLTLVALVAATTRAGADDSCQRNPACQAQTDRAAALAAQTRYEEALTLYQRAYEHWHEPRLLLNIGRCQFRVGQAGKALGSFEALQRALPAADPELSDRLKLFVLEAQAALSEDAGSKPVLTTPPPGAGAAAVSGDYAVHASTDDRCEKQPACQALSEQASQLAAQTRYEEALALYRRAYERYSAPRLLLNIGRCYFRIGRARKALESYNAFLKALPDADPETAARAGQFITDARFAIRADENSLIDRTEPPPSPLDPRGESLVYRARTDHLSRPLWRIGVGSGAMALGLVLTGLGAGALAADGSCVTPSPAGGGQCVSMVGAGGQRSIQLVDGIPTGAALIVTGGLLAIGGIVLVAIPRRHPQTAYLVPTAPAQSAPLRLAF